LPPNVAEHKAVIVPILFEDSKDKVLKKAKEIEKTLGRQNVIFDDREGYSPGWKFSEWEMKGIPLRIEIGPKDLEKKQATIVRRDNGKKEYVKEKDVGKRVGEILEEIQNSLFANAKKFLDSSFDSAKDMKELKKKIEEGKIVKVYMKDSAEIEQNIKEYTGANSRIIEPSSKEGHCVVSGEKVNTIAYIARSY